MSRFYFSWNGNKRTELFRIFDIVNMDEFDIIVEPFCGSGAFILECYARYGDTKKYVFNDTDERLINMMKFIKENKSSAPLYEYCSTRLNADDWKNQQTSDLLIPYNFFYYYRVRTDYQRLVLPKKWPSLNRSKKIEITDKCLSSDCTNITCSDWIECIELYKDDPKALIFIDPPYFNSFNQSYYGMDRVSKGIETKDISIIYMDILFYMETCKARLIYITNSWALFDYVFKKFIRDKYQKKYNTNIVFSDGKISKKTTNHLLLSNF